MQCYQTDNNNIAWTVVFLQLQFKTKLNSLLNLDTY